MPKFCPSCGKQTLFDTGDFDYDEGDKHVCYSCGFTLWMIEAESVYYTCERGRVEEYKPIFSLAETMLAQITGSFALEVYARARSILEETWKENCEVYKGSETIRFRRYEPLPPSEA